MIIWRNSIRRYLKWTFFAALAGPLSIVLHEVGHALMALALGYSNVQITFHSVDRIAPVDIQPWEKAITSEAGPIASLIIILLCCIITLVWRRSIFAKAFGMIAAVQFIGGLIYAVGAILGAAPPTDFDGARFAQYFDISVFFPALAESIFFIGSWTFFIRLIDSSERKLAVLGTVSGGVLGITIWLTFLGPLLLP